MLTYEAGDWGVGFIWQVRGSVIPKALCWAIPSAALAVGVHFLLRNELQLGSTIEDRVSDKLNTSQVWTGYNFLIAFLLTFRTGKAYSRWWEGGTLLRQARGEWFNAYSSLIAFSSISKKPKEDINHFQSVLATLMSHLFCASLNTIAQVEDPFDVLDLAPLSQGGVEFLSEQEDKVELIVVWIQRLIVEGLDGGIVAVPPPVLSRVFQEISRGVVNLNEVRKISEYLFPFPYAQLATCILLLHTFLSPIVSGILLETWYWSFIFTLFSVFAFWSLNYVAVEIECPFGDDDNDLPMVDMSRYFNRTLLMLLNEEAQKVPRPQGYTSENFAAHKPGFVKDFIGIRRSASLLTPTSLKSEDSRCSFKLDAQSDLPSVSPTTSCEHPPGMPSKQCAVAEPCTSLLSEVAASAAMAAAPQLELPQDWEPGDWTTAGSLHDFCDVDPPTKPFFINFDGQTTGSHLTAAATLGDETGNGDPPPADPSSALYCGAANARPGPENVHAGLGNNLRPCLPVGSEWSRTVPRLDVQSPQSETLGVR